MNAPHLLPGYAELHCVSNFSFLRGASHPEELVEEAMRLGYRALAITDECSLAGVVRAHGEIRRLAKAAEAGLDAEPDHAAGPDRPSSPGQPATPGRIIPKLLVGSELRLQPAQGPSFRVVVLAQTLHGYGNLCELITLARTREVPKGSYRLSPEDLSATAAPHAHLAGMEDCLVLLAPEHGIAMAELLPQAQWLARSFPGRAWLCLARLHRNRDDRHRDTVLDAARRCALPVVATGQVEMHRRSRKALHDTLAAIRLGRPVGECGHALAANAEQYLRPRMRLAALYDAPLLAETLAIAERCTFGLDELRYDYPREIVPPGMTPAAYLRRETLAGAQRRYPQGLPEKVRAQIDSELALIADMRFEAYFLTVYDLVRYARSQRILCQGRGSAANSTVCYCLGITEVNPQENDTLFERFISRERNEPPDIDVDFEHQRREEVIQYIYEKYGRQRAALTAVVISYRPRSVLRDTGRALGVDPDVIDAVARAHQWWDGEQGPHAAPSACCPPGGLSALGRPGGGNGLLDRMQACGLDPDSRTARHWAELAGTLMGFPRHLSQHPGGFVISQRRLSRLVPIEHAAMPGRSVVQWDKDDLDAAGLLKVDVLALGMLTVLRRAFAWVAWRRGVPRFGMGDVPREDEATYDMICRADTIGVFQIESRAQMSMLPRLRPRKFYDLVIEVAIVRPGPIQGGMVHPYLRRRQGLEKVAYPKPEIESVLRRTQGVPIFQEQVMRIAMVAAGFSADEADSLRRSMAAWRRKGGVDKFRGKLVGGLLANGYEPDFAEAIFRQVEGFGEYGFPESHAASFAILAYISSWLKRHEPEAFLAALLDSQPMGFYAPAQLIQDARRHGVAVLPADVAASDWECLLCRADTQAGDALAGGRRRGPERRTDGETDDEPHDGPRPAVRLGLNQVRGLGEDAGRRIAQARAAGGPYADVRDLARRAGLQRRELDALAAAGALRSLAGHRRLARWAAAAGGPPPGLLRQAERPDDRAPALPAPSEGQDISADYRALGYTLGRHPLALLREQLARLRFAPAAALAGYPSGRLARACGLVTVRQRPQTARGVIFVTLEDETGPVNVVVRQELAQRQRRELLDAPLLGVIGVWQNADGIRHLVAGRLEDHTRLLGELAAATRSRDFH